MCCKNVEKIAIAITYIVSLDAARHDVVVAVVVVVVVMEAASLDFFKDYGRTWTNITISQHPLF